MRYWTRRLVNYLKYYITATLIISFLGGCLVTWNFRFHPKLINFFPYDSKTAGRFTIVNRVQKIFNLDMGGFSEYSNQEIYFDGDTFDIAIESKYGPEERLVLARSNFVKDAVVLQKNPAAILMRVGKDMDNDSAFVLLLEKNRKVEAITLAHANLHEFAWLDKIEPTATKFPFSEVDFLNHDLLWIESQTILNTETLEYHKLKSPNWQGAVFVGWSPERTNMARFTYSGGDSFILNNNIKTGEFSKHRIDREIMWYDLSTQVDADWFSHYFQWVKNENESYSLVEKRIFLKRPYRGYYSKDSNGLQFFKLTRFNIEAFGELEIEINKYLGVEPKKDSWSLTDPPAATGIDGIKSHEFSPKENQYTVLEYNLTHGKIKIYLKRDEGLSISISDARLEPKFFYLVDIIHQYIDRHSNKMNK